MGGTIVSQKAFSASRWLSLSWGSMAVSPRLLVSLSGTLPGPPLHPYKAPRQILYGGRMTPGRGAPRLAAMPLTPVGANRKEP
jgi:hypothetical protein